VNLEPFKTHFAEVWARRIHLYVILGAEISWYLKVLELVDDCLHFFPESSSSAQYSISGICRALVNVNQGIRRSKSMDP
jgi:hypothetical protein